MTPLSCVKLALTFIALAAILSAQTANSGSAQAAQSAEKSAALAATAAMPAAPADAKPADLKPNEVKPGDSKPEDTTAGYVLGPDDKIIVRAVGIDEFAGQPGVDAKPAIVDLRGYVDVPIVGKVKAAGLTVQQLEQSITDHLRKYVRDPEVTVTVTEFKSQPVSIVGSVMQPGTYHLTGQNTLVQVLSQAQGLTDDASNKIHITREKAQGPIPLPGCTEDPSGKFYTATVNTKLLLDAKDPEANIKVKPNDVVSVPKAEMVYVVGAVIKSGGFVLNERESISVLQAISMSEGLEKTSAASRAKIIRRGDSNQRVEIPTDLKKILAGQAPDQQLYANDILFVPTSGPKTVSLRALEAMVQAGTGIAIYRR